MKKKLLILLVLLGIINILEAGSNKKKDCYIPKGELTCVTDLSTEEGIKKAMEMETRKDEVYKAANIYFEKGRFGNEQVGFIAYPKGNWALFYDPDASLSAFQIANGTDIYIVKDLLGHTNVKTTQIYAKVMNEKKNEAVKAIKLNIKK